MHCIVAQWLLHWTLGQGHVVWVRAPDGSIIMLFSWARHITLAHTCQPPEYKNLETTPKIFKVGAIFISGRFFFGISLFSMQLQYITYEINELEM